MPARARRPVRCPWLRDRPLGGALPHAEGVLIVTSRMREITVVRREDQRAVVEPGRRQPRRDAGGARRRLLLRAGPVEPADLHDRRQRGRELRRRALPEVRLDHQPRARRRGRVADGETVAPRRAAPDSPGYDLLGAVVGSEGTLGVVTEVTVRLVRLPEEVAPSWSASTPPTRPGPRSSAIIAAGIVPAAIEMMDALAIEAAERRCSGTSPTAPARCSSSSWTARWPRWSRRTPRWSLAAAARAARSRAARPTDAAERALIWKARKSGVRRDGPDQPNYSSQDGVIPRTALPEVLARDRGPRRRLRRARRQRVPRRRRQPAPARALRRGAARARRGGRGGAARSSTCASRTAARSRASTASAWTKRADMARMFTETTSTRMQLVRCAFDPTASPTRARSSRRRGCAARSRDATRARTRSKRPAWRRCSE